MERSVLSMKYHHYQTCLGWFLYYSDFRLRNLIWTLTLNCEPGQEEEVMSDALGACASLTSPQGKYLG